LEVPHPPTLLQLAVPLLQAVADWPVPHLWLEPQLVARLERSALPPVVLQVLRALRRAARAAS